MTSGSELRRGLAVLVLICSWTAGARAQHPAGDAEMRTVARDLAQQGAEAFERAQYDVALDRFTRAHAIYGAPSLLLMQARTLRNLGRLTEAADAYEKTQRTPISPAASEVYRRAIADAQREGAELAARMPRLLVRIGASEEPLEDVTVRLDGKALPSALLDVERPIDPGSHEIRATARGLDPVVRRVTVAEGEHVVVELPFERSGGTPAARASAVVPVESSVTRERGGSMRRTASFVTLGVGGAALVFAGVTGFIALDKQSSLDAACRPGCPKDSADDIDAFRLNRTLSYGGAAIGAVALGVGGYLFFTSPRAPDGVAVQLSPVGVRLRGHF